MAWAPDGRKFVIGQNHATRVPALRIQNIKFPALTTIYEQWIKIAVWKRLYIRAHRINAQADRTERFRQHRVIADPNSECSGLGT